MSLNGDDFLVKASWTIRKGERMCFESKYILQKTNDTRQNCGFRVLLLVFLNGNYDEEVWHHLLILQYGTQSFVLTLPICPAGPCAVAPLSFSCYRSFIWSQLEYDNLFNKHNQCEKQGKN